MIKQHYTGNSRRAMNIIWNAAQDYEWNSPFLAFHPNGKPDDYLNMVIGLTAKWLDRDRITDFFERLGQGPTIDEASVLLWLGIENCVYGKELPHRPVLARMRAQRAEEFFQVNGMLSEQQMSFMSIRVYDQELIRWSHVLGRKVLTVGPAAMKLSHALEFSPEWDTDEVLARMHQILKEYFRMSLSDASGRKAVGRGGLWKALTRPFSGRETRKADLLVLRKGTGSGDAKRSVHLTHNFGELHTSADSAEDRTYIENAFGPCMYTDGEMRILENSLCVGDDAGCRLWFTKEKPENVSALGLVSARRQGAAPTDAKDQETAHINARNQGAAHTNAKDQKAAPINAKGQGPAHISPRLLKEGQKLRKDRDAQRARNREYYKTHQFKILESIRNLSAQTEVIFQTYLRRLESNAKRGKLDGGKAWRMKVMGDSQIFRIDSDISDSTVCVDLLLDASQSRMNSQEMIACQALVIARSFEQSHIPVRVTAFRSLRGYTILERLKDFGDRRGDGIFGFYAGGWNRDALCLKAMEYLMVEEKKQGRSDNRILLVLTDANPNDSVQMPPKEGSLFAREYEGDDAVKDAVEAVRMLTSDGIHTGALYYGSTSHLDNVHQIYGQMYVRVKTLNQLPDAVSELLRRSLSQMPD